MQAHIKLGRLFGVQIGLHFTWLLIALLITFSLAGHWRAMHAQWGPGLVWTMAIVTGLLFFAALIAHELAMPWWHGRVVYQSTRLPSLHSAASPRLRRRPRMRPRNSGWG